MSEKLFIGNVAQKAIIVKDGKVMISRDSRDASLWEIPGGRLSADEIPSEGLKREILEELGVAVNIGQIVHVEQFLHGTTPHLLLAYEVTFVDPAIPFTFDPVEVAEIRWIDKTELGNYTFYSNILNALKAYWKV